MHLVERTAHERFALEEAQQAVRSVRVWRRFQANRMLAGKREAGEVTRWGWLAR